MKKLIFAAAAVAGMGAFALESANVVGYTEFATETKKQPSFGACFTPINGAMTYKLKDLVPTDFNVDEDMIQIINPTTLATDARYVYMSKEIADAAAEEDGEEPGAYDELIGWWDPVLGVGEDGAAAGDTEIKVGQAFLGLFKSGVDIKFQSSGSVPLTSTGISTDAKKQPFFANYLPKTIKLGAIVPEGFNVDEDMIQVINPASLATDARYVYMSKEIADAAAEEDGEAPGAYDELIGWWDPVIGVGEDGASANDADVVAGAAFLGLFKSGVNITFQFPAAL